MLTIKRYLAILLEIARGIPVHISSARDEKRRILHNLYEQGLLLNNSALTAENYYYYGLNSRKLQYNEKRKYVGTYKRWQWMDQLNPPEHRHKTEDKVVFKHYLQSIGIPVAPLLAIFGSLDTAYPCPVLESDDEIANWLRQSSLENAFIKPVEGGQGGGVISLGPRLDSSTWVSLPSGEITAEEIIGRINSMGSKRTSMVEERLVNHQEIRRFSPGVLHTLRIFVADPKDPKILAAALRIGLGDSPCDNASAGNLVSSVDLGSGVLSAAVVRAPVSKQTRFPRHPVSDELIENSVLPYWQETMELAATSAAAFSYGGLLAWDIAITPDGPVVVEANDLWDSEGIQLALGHGLLYGDFESFLMARGLYPGLGHR